MISLPWTAELPSSWNIVPARAMLKSVRREPRSMDMTVTAFRDGQVTLRSNRRIDGFTESVKDIGYQGVRQGEVVIHSMDAFAGAIGVSDSDGKMSPVVHIYTAPSDSPEFLVYSLRVASRAGFIRALAKGIRERSTSFDRPVLKTMLLPRPPREDQDAIVDYLDRETQKIDELITEQRGLIETLRERSRAIIERAVTHGVSGDATESSEIPWLYGGQVVVHWTTSRIKYMFSSLRAGAMIPADSINADGDYPVYGGNGKRGYTNDFTHDGVHILIGRQGALCGNVHLCQGRFWSSEHAIVGEPVRNVAPRWLEFLLRIMDLGQYSMASAQPGIGVGQIATLQIPFPPPSEQREIIEYLDGQTARIDELIAESEDLIALSQERRAALITAAVTGQIDVRTET